MILTALFLVASLLDPSSIVLDTRVSTPSVPVDIVIAMGVQEKHPPHALQFDLVFDQGVEPVLDADGNPTCRLADFVPKDIFQAAAEGEDGRTHVRVIVLALDQRYNLALPLPGPIAVCPVVLDADARPGFYLIGCREALYGSYDEHNEAITEDFPVPCTAGGVMYPPGVDTPLACPGDMDLSRTVTIAEVIAAVNAALVGCKP